MRRALRAFSTVLVVAGTLLLVEVGVTVFWQEPLSAFLAHREQSRLSQRLSDLERSAPTRTERRALALLASDRRRLAFLARSLRRRTPDGDALGRIRIPRLGVSFVVVNGTDPADLRKGPGF